MEYLGEIFAFGIDTIVFAICLKQYNNYKHAVKKVEVNNVWYLLPVLKHVNVKKSLLK